MKTSWIKFNCTALKGMLIFIKNLPKVTEAVIWERLYTVLTYDKLIFIVCFISYLHAPDVYFFFILISCTMNYGTGSYL